MEGVRISGTRSVELDDSLRTSHPGARWDYVLATDRECVGMEVHPAKASEVDRILRKKRWAEDLLRVCGVRVARWCWIRPLGSSLQFTSISPQARRLAAGGVQFPTAVLF
jgi:hypothetical protein